MSSTHVSGKEIIIAKPIVSVFGLFDDFTRFTGNVPPQYQTAVSAQKDSIRITVKGFSLGVRIRERIPFSYVSLEGDEMAPFPFLVSFHLSPVGLDSTMFHIEVDAELNMMMKMMIGSKLQSAIDKLTDQIEAATKGEMPDLSQMKPEQFS
ncbi:MAG: hypothetical protein KBS57_01055 [Alistipes sp.]|nr:hypothetical protein [Candidatus Minthomonas equi]